MSRTLTKFRVAALLAGAALSALTLAAPGASALVRQPGGVVYDPVYCVAVYGDPNPCPPPERPEPVDPTCLRTDILPLHCAWLP